jgi:hypothetical protein
MGKMGLLRRLWLTRLSKPAAERVLYRHAFRTPPQRIIELGIGLLTRTERLLQAVGSHRHPGSIHYVGLDRFEGRVPSDPPGVTLKQAHQRLNKLAKVQLVPGNVDTSLSRLCNHLGAFDLVVISAEADERHLERCWFFLQRITTAATTVFLESRTATGAVNWSLLPKARIDELAAKTVLRRAG